jgi:lysophospholipase L1-like esterase
MATALTIAIAITIATPDASARMPPGFWQKTLRKFQAEDAKNAPQGGVVFVGSSSIRLWHTPTFFPKLPAVNRGLGGAQIDDVHHFADRLVFPYAPRVLVFYAGENDIAAGHTPGQVLADYRAFVELVRRRLPETRIFFLSIKPSVVLRPLWGKVREANRLVEELCASDPQLRYVDVATSMLGPKGGPRRELFQDDGLHMNAAGYRLWTRLIAPAIEAALAEP